MSQNSMINITKQASGHSTNTVVNPTGFQKQNILSDTQFELSKMHRYVKDLHINATILANDTQTDSEKERALSMIGHIGYAGGLEVTQVLLAMLPDIIPLLHDNRRPSMQLQALRSLSEICHRNRAMQDFFLQRREAIDKIIQMIENLTHVRLCRWACYMMLNLVVDNVPFTRTMRARSDLIEALRGVVGLQLPWISWGANYSEVLLTYLGDKTVTERMISKLIPGSHYYRDVVVHESDTTISADDEESI